MKSKKTSVIVLLAILFLVSILHVVDNFFSANVDKGILSVSHLLLSLSFIYFAIMRRNLTTWILISMVIGALIGHEFPVVGQNMRVLSQVFLKLIKTIIAPILFSTLVVGIAGHSNLRQVGRMGWKSIVYFEIVTTFALFIGLIAINISKAGVGIQMPPDIHETLPEVQQQTWQDIILHIFPENIARSIYHAEVLPIVVFSVLFGIGLAMVDEKKKRPMLEFCESLAETMFKFTNIIMYFAPVGVGAAIAYTVGHMGLGILVNLAQLLMTLYVALILFILLVLLPVALIAKVPIVNFLKAVLEPMSIAFATTSSESALPKAMQAMERLGVPRKIVAFVIPTGYSFNLDGTTLYLSLASIFVAQAAGIHMDIPTQLFLVFTLMLTSKGVAGVPRASLVILLATAAQFNLPTWPILIILGIDELMDMARTATNVLGNCLASCVVARWEGEFEPRDPTIPLESELRQPQSA
ncbi:MAG: cation:dicarboxylase symporter family transporter [Saprospiraceae bacterium]|mgnify:CR=1 FL=1|jgi:proton glutamate symport protein|nr:MAG: sodium:dicarboxylate symporter [Candidatus Parvibacillus calidus]MBX2937717.1 cation:dicarboxylase symporter family transporter [Saprospiraceae bacterium]MBK7740135.1 cation:dicarboxylase symporter family transporter [Candidatus Parvibacillus calidus]MBX7178531.1 cation:dicarboxylase symporter family transporter [Saprospiraceae bacterium]MCB0590290.1 cation:dicarboxylase symporter family transporter [Saprospiraceae bacterium]